MHCVYGVFTGTGLIRRKMRVVVTPGDVKPGFHCTVLIDESLQFYSKDCLLFSELPAIFFLPFPSTLINKTVVGWIFLDFISMPCLYQNQAKKSHH